MTDEEKRKCQKIIHGASIATGAIGFAGAQLPGSDTVPITAIQVGMIISLGSLFGKEITKAVATSIIGGFTASFTGRGVSQLLVGWLPGVGNVLNAGTAAAITEALGWFAANMFAEGEKAEGDDNEQ